MGWLGFVFFFSLIWLGCFDGMWSFGWLGSLGCSWFRILIYFWMRCSVKDWGGEIFIDVD